MEKELLAVENGVIFNENAMIVSDLYLRLFSGEVMGMLFSGFIERRLFIEFLNGKIPMESGKLYLHEENTTPVALMKYLNRRTTIIGRNSKLIASMSIEENVFLFMDKSHFTHAIRYKEQFDTLRQAYGVLDMLPSKASELSAKQTVMIELLKACAEEKQIVILDDLTGFLTRGEIDEIGLLIRKISPLCTFIIVLGYEDTGIRWMDSITVVKNGRTLTNTVLETNNLQHIIRSLIDNNKKPFEDMPVAASAFTDDLEEATLEFMNIYTPYLKNIHLSLHAGELIKIFFMNGLCKDEILDLLFCGKQPISGEIRLLGKIYHAKNIHEAIGQGVCIIEQMPFKNMLIDSMSIVENLSMPLHDKIPFFWSFDKYEKSAKIMAAELIPEIKYLKKLKDLSGAALQQLAYVKWMLYSPKVIVCINPFLGLDINMEMITIKMLEIYKEMGIAIIILTSNVRTVQNIEGETLYLSDGQLIDEEEAYQKLYPV